MFLKNITILIFSLLLILPTTLLAQETVLEGTQNSQYTAEYCAKKENKESCAANPKCAQFCGQYQVSSFVAFSIKAARIIIALSGTLAFAVMIYGGFLMVISGSSNRHAEGKNALLGAAIGLVIIFCSFVIVNYTLKAIGYDRSDWYKFTTK